jgi:hypothetical protein
VSFDQISELFKRYARSFVTLYTARGQAIVPVNTVRAWRTDNLSTFEFRPGVIRAACQGAVTELTAKYAASSRTFHPVRQTSHGRTRLRYAPGPQAEGHFY